MRSRKAFACSQVVLTSSALNSAQHERNDLERLSAQGLDIAVIDDADPQVAKAAT
jgi:hypothetical protein